MLNENVNYRNAEQTLSGVASGACFITKWVHKIPWNPCSSTAFAHDTRIETCSLEFCFTLFLFVFWPVHRFGCGYRLLLLPLSLHFKIQSTPYYLPYPYPLQRVVCVPVCLTTAVSLWFRLVFVLFFLRRLFGIGDSETAAAATPDTTHTDDLQFKCISLVAFDSFGN